MNRRAALPALVLALVLGVLTAFGPRATADEYPSRTVTIIVPYPAGGPTDQLARLVAKALTAKFKQNFIVENVSGGGTIIATKRAINAAPDGYTLLLHNLQVSANASLYKNLPFDTAKDLTPIMFLTRNPLILVGRKTLDAKTTADLFALMKKAPIKTAIPGFGSTGHLASALLAQEAKVKVDLIPYRGAAPALKDILGGHVDIFFSTPQSVVQQVKTGAMKAYGITTKEKSPDFPTAESFVGMFGPKLEIMYWQALFAPSKTPPAVVNKLNAALQEMVSDPEILKMWARDGVSAYPKDERTVAAGRALLDSEIARWGKVIKDNNIRPNQ